jgi:hypothetical protein
MKKDDLFSARMPEVDIREDIEEVFIRAREAADQSKEGEDGLLRRQVIIVTPGRLLIAKECPIPPELPAEALEMLIGLAPPNPPRKIAVIAYTLLEALKSDLRRAIPFIDILLGFGTLGHSMWIFEGHPSALTAGCREADLLLVDSAMLAELEMAGNWQETALAAMRGNEIKVIAR